jgi:hypothetical protein
MFTNPASFRLRPDKVISFLQGGHKPLPGYRAPDHYEPIELPGGEVLFLKERVDNLYDAYWYPSVKDFDTVTSQLRIKSRILSFVFNVVIFLALLVTS